MKVKHFFDSKYTYYVLLSLFVIFGFNFEVSARIINSDDSFIWAMNNIFANGEYRFGKDIFFTYGPLGWLVYPFMDNPYVWVALIFKLSVIATYVFLLWQYRGKKYANLFMLLFMLPFIFFGHYIFSIHNARMHLMYEILAAILGITCVFAKSSKHAFMAFVLLNLYALLMFFVKFNLGIVFGGTLAISIIFRQFSKRDILLTFAIWILGISGMIIFYFHGIEEFIEWIKYSIIISSGYGEAMMLSGEPFMHYVILAIVIFLGFICSWLGVNKSKNSKKEYLKLLWVLLPSAFLAFKAAVIRADDHLMIFYSYMLAIIPLLIFWGYKYCSKALLYAFAVCYVMLLPFASHYVFTGSWINDIAKWRNASEIQVAKFLEIKPQWAEVVKDASIEAIPLDFPFIVKHKKRAAFNPIIHLYQVYNKTLDDLSEKHYKNQKSDFVLISGMMPVDARALVWDNPATWRAIRDNYEIVDNYNDKFLLKRKAEPTQVEYEILSQNKYSLNEKIPVPYDAELADIELNLSFIGKLMNLFYRGTPLFIIVQDDNNRKMLVRQIRDVMKNGLYIKGVVATPQQMKRYLQDLPPLDNINSLAIITDNPLMFEDQMTITWRKRLQNEKGNWGN